MPLTGNRESDFHDFRHGKTYKRTAGKYGKKKANKQMIAAVLHAERDKKGRKKKRSAKRTRQRSRH